MAAIHGKNGKMSIGPSTANSDVSEYLKSTGLDQNTDTVEVTTFGNDSKLYIPGLEDGTISLEGVWDATIDGIMATMKGVTGKFSYLPAGTGVTYAGDIILTSYNVSQDMAGEITFSASFQVTGDISRTP